MGGSCTQALPAAAAGNGLSDFATVLFSCSSSIPLPISWMQCTPVQLPVLQPGGCSTHAAVPARLQGRHLRLLSVAVGTQHTRHLRVCCARSWPHCCSTESGASGSSVAHRWRHAALASMDTRGGRNEDPTAAGGGVRLHCLDAGAQVFGCHMGPPSCCVEG